MRRLSVLAAIMLIAASAPACHRFDQREVPVLSLGTGLRPEIAWTPSPAYMLMVYEGDRDGNGLGVLWSVAAAGGYENGLQSPVVYGVPPAGSEYVGAPPLQAGKTYTVTVTRKDEQGTGDGFTARRHRYIGAVTFVAVE